MSLLPVHTEYFHQEDYTAVDLKNESESRSSKSRRLKLTDLAEEHQLAEFLQQK